MTELQTTKKKFLDSPKHLILTGVVCLIVLSSIVAVQIVRADGRILPNVTIGGIEVGGLTPEEARTRLENAMRAVNVGGAEFRYKDRSLTVRANDVSAAPPSQAPITYDLDGMVRAAFAFGHEEGQGSLIKANVHALFAEVRQPTLLTVDENALRGLLTLRFGNLEQPAKDAGFAIAKIETVVPAEDASSTPQTIVSWRVDVEPDSTGVTFDYDDAIRTVTASLDRWQGAAVDLQATTKTPAVTTAAATGAKDRVVKTIQRGDVSLAYDDQTWTLSQKTIAEALTLKPWADGTLGITLKPEVIEPLLEEAAKEIETDAKPTSFTVKDGRAIDFIGGTVGKDVDRELTLARFDEQFENSPNGLFPIAVDITASPKSDPLAEELGIRELLGYGTSNFAGSPKNRRINIANGAARLNGLIIKPGQELGLLEYLRPFTAAGGYVPELVIKNNRTVPEFGGGLCQIGTTTFRAVMGAGLPITQRQNHSYRVVYYEPAGTDATLYDPAPDFKFINDTASHAVLVTKVIGDSLRFELWGTRDGRVQAQSKVKIWNVNAPPAPKLIETAELAEGVKKCFESAHAGATTDFVYSITYPDGTVKSKDFHSVYRPWQAQCLIGKPGAARIIMQRDGAIKELPPVETATSTPVTS